MGFFEVFAAALAGFYALVGNYGVAIILLTVAVRILLLPLSIKQTRSMREMQRIQPEVKKIQTKHKGDRQKMNEEMMALYKEHGVNPFGGCLPLLMQFPVFIALYRLIATPLAYMGYKLSGTEEWEPQGVSGILKQVQDSALARGLDTAAAEVNSFLGVFRLDCKPAEIYSETASCAGGIVGLIPYLILIGLMGFTTFYQQKQMQAQRGPTTDPQAQQMQVFMKIMPFMLMVFSFNFAAGLTLYWLTTNVWSIAQQHLMLRVAPAHDAPADKGDKALVGAGKGATKPSSGKPPKGAPSKPATGDRNAQAESSKQPSKHKKKKR